MAALNAGHFPPLPPPPPPYLGQQGNAPGADPPQPLALGAPHLEKQPLRIDTNYHYSDNLIYISKLQLSTN
ncbi:hypothetical protein DICSQDRAFT_170665 [Dichomitus squalens LYAD-421 SS1]|uniref:Uncharacterized protein n=1 Tax=Dichomitus squalens (strain LYAD-421) TaxID=732165 RepID=R7SXA4_DICSQ|nr:uncharacterized protein DICSQDRAFT_170665 [Dichomitus squalens LYAD-421 SS1]EJF60804.1 hypothetical protein DICSQDRAFT_170665 [Dichomitus squalens LYAD-421 SS1]